MAKPLPLVIAISWGIALIEYCLAGARQPARLPARLSAGQLKITQEAIALVVFGVFMVAVLGEPIHWRFTAAFACIMAAVAFMFVGK